MDARPRAIVALLVAAACTREDRRSELTAPVLVEQGGTGATTAAGARANLGTPALVGPNTLSGDLTLASGSFVGDGSGLASVPASALTGTVPGVALSGTYPEALALDNPANSFSGAFAGAFTGDGSGLDVLRRWRAAPALEGCALDAGTILCGGELCDAGAGPIQRCTARSPPCAKYCVDPMSPVASSSLARPILPAPGAVDLRVDRPVACRLLTGEGSVRLSLRGDDCVSGVCAPGQVIREASFTYPAGGWTVVPPALDSGFPWFATAGQKEVILVAEATSAEGACFLLREAPAGTANMLRAVFRPLGTPMATW